MLLPLSIHIYYVDFPFSLTCRNSIWFFYTHVHVFYLWTYRRVEFVRIDITIISLSIYLLFLQKILNYHFVIIGFFRNGPSFLLKIFFLIVLFKLHTHFYDIGKYLIPFTPSPPKRDIDSNCTSDRGLKIG